MTDKTIELDYHRGTAAQQATELRRLLADVEANEKALRIRQAKPGRYSNLATMRSPQEERAQWQRDN
jgi:hypothetical protein